MPINPNNYPPDWKEISRFIRFQRAQGRCECTGQCGLHQPNPHYRRCTERHHHKARYANGLVTLTAAHICHCNPPCSNPGHIIAACQRCHLRIDRQLHAQHAAATRAQRVHTKLASTRPNVYTKLPRKHPLRDPRRHFGPPPT
jgi:hypothetical protein